VGESFSVDTHVFRELGELLVGRDSTALIELIKNSYDADATEVTVFGQSLGDVRSGYILISDNGLGMTDSNFRDGFLRIASRGKEQGTRRSLRYKRRFTGAKGIGRLAAHKLAEVLSVDSVPAKEIGSSVGVNARIDWKLVEQFQTLEELAASNTANAISVNAVPTKPSMKAGTVIRLERLRRAWSETELFRFVSEVQSFSPPQFLVSPEKSMIKPNSFLFGAAKVTDVRKTSTFVPTLQGDFSPSADYWQAFANSADWLIEIDAATDTSKILYQLTPTVEYRKDFPKARKFAHSVPHPGVGKVPAFQARIIVREGQQGGAPLKGWAASNSGVRIFMEGFRVLPYGERSNDWLELDRHYAERARSSEFLKLFNIPALEMEDSDNNALLAALPNRNYYGCVFLTQEGSPGLQMLVNREGFVPNDSLDNLSRLVRLGIDLTVRARAAAKREQKQAEAVQSSSQPVDRSEESVLTAAIQSVSNVRTLISTGSVKEATKSLAIAEESMRDLASRVSEESAMLRILASVGSQMTAFVHEINATLGMAEAIDKTVERLAQSDVSASARRELNRIHKAVGDLRRQLERQASYLVDIVSPDARRRRSRTGLNDRFEAATKLLTRSAEARDITIENEIPVALKSPPMFPAELTSIFTNLLTNAIKAAGAGGRIRATGRIREGRDVLVRVENTGEKIAIVGSERWFQPFESTTANVDTVLGQGMGLGLTITRNMLEQYGAQIRFISPTPGFATSIEISFPL